jgi:hypothetical protein
MVTVMIEVTDNCCCCVSLYLDIGSPQPGQERGGGVGTVRRTAELGREQSSSNLYPQQYLNISFFMYGGHLEDSSRSRNGRVSKWAGHRRARVNTCCQQLSIGRTTESPSTAAVFFLNGMVLFAYICAILKKMMDCYRG